MLIEASTFEATSRTEHLIDKSTRQLIQSTQRVVEAAMELVREGEIDDSGRQTVQVRDPKSKQVYEICDSHPEHFSQYSSFYPPEEPAYKLEGGLFIAPLNEDRNGQLTKTQGSTKMFPRLAQLVTEDVVRWLQIVNYDIKPRAMRKVAEQLGRAAIIK